MMENDDQRSIEQREISANCVVNNWLKVY